VACSTLAGARLQELNVWPGRIEPGRIEPGCIEPGRPDQNGRPERMHCVLCEDAVNLPAAGLEAQRRRVDEATEHLSDALSGKWKRRLSVNGPADWYSC